jgi:hypothetical protein
LGPDETIFAGNVSAGLLRRAEHYLPIEWVRSAFEILPDGDIVAVPPGTLREGLTKDLQPTDRKCHPDELSYLLEGFSGLWIGLRAAVEAAKKVALAHKNDEIEAAGMELKDALRSELAYLRAQNVNSATKDMLHERETLLASVRCPSVATDGVAIVIGSGGR